MNHTGAPTEVVTAKTPEYSADQQLGACSDRIRRAKPARVPTECGDLPFLIKRDGTRLYRGSPINRKELVCLFSSVLRREEDGSWWLQTPAERGRIEVEDAPFVAVELDWTGDGRHQVLSFRTNIDGAVLWNAAEAAEKRKVLRQCCQCQFTFANVKVVEQQAHPHTPVSRAQYLVRQEPTGYVLRPSVILEIKRPGRCASAEDTPGEGY